jgi:hypothetical protein
MSKWLACAAIPTSGVRHRMIMLSCVKHFAVSRGYSVCMLWGVTSHVSFCRFEELFSPISGVEVINISAEQLGDLMQCLRAKKNVRMGNKTFRPVVPGSIPRGDLFSWDLSVSSALADLVPGRPVPTLAKPSAKILREVDAYVRKHGVEGRLGIRVRVEERLGRDRKPHRTKRELDEVLKSIVRIPWYTRVFVATDSEYIQQMLASHFTDMRFMPKKFDLEESSGRYVHRQDKEAMFTFLKEVDCLCRCKRIINIGRFLNDHSVREKWLSEPYREAAYMHLVHPSRRATSHLRR